MFQTSIFLQAVSLLIFLLVGAIFVATFIPKFAYYETLGYEDGRKGQIMMAILLIALLRGAF